MDSLMLDGNAVAGLLQEVFAVEMTNALGTCGKCAATEPVGAVHVFQGAGVVMRCPHCDNPLLTIVKDDARVWISVRGLRVLEVAIDRLGTVTSKRDQDSDERHERADSEADG